MGGYFEGSEGVHKLVQAMGDAWSRKQLLANGRPPGDGEKSVIISYIRKRLSTAIVKGSVSHSVLKGGELRNFVFRENQLTGALAGVELSRDQPAAEVDQVILTHFWPKNGQKWPKITIVTVRLPGGPKLVDQT